MELSFSSLRAKEVVNTKDGRKLGRVCDVALCYPENRWLGIVVPGGKGWGRKKNDLFIDLKQIVKIGEDVILVNVGLPTKQGGKRAECAPPPKNAGFENGGDFGSRRSFEEYE